MKEKLLRVVKLAVYPAFYLVCLLIFGYLTFPFDRLKDRLLSEIGKQSKGKNAPVISVEKLDSYWLSGAELENLKIVLPADNEGASFGSNKGFGAMGGFGAGAGASEPSKDSVIEVKEAHARARLLPLLIGRVQLDFWASVFGGEVEGTAPAGGSKGDVELKLEDLKLSEVEPLQNLLGIPIDGKVNGELSLSPLDGKFSKANGKLELSIKNIVVSDGKTKIQGLLVLPPAKVDELAVVGEADKGVMKITKLNASGPDLELDGDGKINLREPWAESSVDLYIKFRFTDAYRGKDSTTKSILGEPGSSAPPLIEQVSKLKKAKRADGFYGFHVHGKLKRLEFTPSSTDASGSSGSAAAGSRVKGKGIDVGAQTPPFGAAGKKLGGVALPVGMSTALSNHERDKDAEDKKEDEKKEPEERKMAAPMPVPPPAPSPEPTPEPEPPLIVPPPNAQPDNPGGGPDKPGDDKPAEEPR